jgi:protein-tyrosine-phosphatase/DNA-binding transcriptional ArsR family regulator
MDTQPMERQAPTVLKLLAHDLRWTLLQQLVRSDYRVAELVEQVEQPLNLVSYHLRLLRRAGLVRERRSTADERSFYYSLDLERMHTFYLEAASSLHPSLGEEITPGSRAHWSFAGPAPRLLFLCTSNSARSQMAEALVHHLGQGQVQAFSAGSHPAQAVNPLAIRTLVRWGVQMSQSVPKHLDLFVGQSFDRVITLCDRVREQCPSWPGSPPLIHWSFPDPSAAEGSEAERQLVFDHLARQLNVRIRLLLTLLEQERRETVSGQKTPS